MGEGHGKQDANRRAWEERAAWYREEWRKIIAWLDRWHRANPGYERWFPLEPEAHGHEIPRPWDLEKHMTESAAKFLAGDFTSIRDKPPYGVGKFLMRSRTNIGTKMRPEEYPSATPVREPQR
jgi:hypothetical protein